MDKTPFETEENHDVESSSNLLKNPLTIIVAIVFVLSVLATTYLLVFPAQKKQTPSTANNQNITPTLSSTTASTDSNVSPAEKAADTPTLTPTPTLDPVENWATFTNSVYGYSIKYPKNWTAVNFGSTDTNIVSFFVFNPNGMPASSKSIYIEISKRTYAQQLAIDGGGGTSITLSGITGKKQPQKDSDGNKSVTIVLPRSKNLLILHAKNSYAAVFNGMLTSLKITQK